jgi:hypothetical protein
MSSAADSVDHSKTAAGTVGLAAGVRIVTPFGSFGLGTIGLSVSSYIEYRTISRGRLASLPSRRHCPPVAQYFFSNLLRRNNNTIMKDFVLLSLSFPLGSVVINCHPVRLFQILFKAPFPEGMLIL